VRSLVLVTFFIGLIFLVQRFFPKLIMGSEVSSESESLVDDQYHHNLKGIHLVESFKDDKEWELFAEAARSHAFESKWSLEKVRVHIVDHKGELIKIKGNQASFYSKEKKLHIFGNVDVETKNGYFIKTKEIFYTSQDRQLFTVDPVTIMRKETIGDNEKSYSSIEGGFMRTSMNDSEMLLGGRVKASRKIAQGLNLIVESSEAKLFREKKAIEFYQDVLIQWGPNEFRAQQGTFHYNEKERRLETVTLLDQVKMRSRSRHVTCGKAVLNILRGVTELSGKPKVYDTKSFLEGEFILLDHEEDTVSVKKIEAIFENR
jgi:LPS export ABC transporter protein LptC